jgi:hypothetical protein
MKPSRLLLLLVAGCCFLRSEPASAQSAAPPYVFPKQFSSDETVTTKDGNVINIKAYMDNGKVRSEVNRSGMQIISIIRPDEQKMFTVLEAQKMVMASALDPAKLKQYLPPGSGGDAKMETVGPDTIDGTPATKYKITSDNGKVVYLWVGTASQFPLKLTPDDGGFTLVWKNFQAGPQDPSLFEPPAGYQVINAPAGMPAPGGP